MDVKSDNLTCDASGIIKLLPSKFIFASADMEKKPVVVGTPYWMSPEVIRGLQANYKACVWSMGVVLYELLAEDAPYIEYPPLRALFLITTKGLPPFKDLPSEYDEAIEFFKICTRKDVKERPYASELLVHPFMAHGQYTEELLQHVQLCEPMFEVREAK
jgi:p21-activated kinase 1